VRLDAVRFVRLSLEHGRIGPGPGSGVAIKAYGSFRWGNAHFFILSAFEDWRGDEGSWLPRARRAVYAAISKAL